MKKVSDWDFKDEEELYKSGNKKYSSNVMWKI